MASGRTAGKAKCEDCFFEQHGLCAMTRSGQACPTYRPNHPEGLRPPRQMTFVFRQERRVWAFPTAQEQHALHA